MTTIPTPAELDDYRRMDQQAAAEMRAIEAMRVLAEYYGHTRDDLHVLVDEAIEATK